MRRLALGLVLVLAPAGAAADKPPKMEPYTSESGRFKVLLPDEPKREAKTLKTAAGTTQLTTERVEVGRDLVLAVAVAVYPEGFKDVGSKTILDGVRDGLKGADGTVVSEKSITLPVSGTDAPGREFRVEAGSKAVRCRAYLVENRLYQVMATGTRDAVGGGTADLFIKSFELVGDE